MKRLTLALAMIASPALADRLPAPDYFVQSAFLTSTAQIIAQACPSLSVDPIAAARITEDTLQRLTEDGFTSENLVERMEDPSEAIGALQTAFVTRHNLVDGAETAQVCAAGLAEIAQESGIGRLLVDVSTEETAQ